MRKTGLSFILIIITALIVAVLYFTQMSHLKTAGADENSTETVTERTQNAVDNYNEKVAQDIENKYNIYD